MAATPDPNDPFPVPEDHRVRGPADRSDGDDVLAPVIAGAFARGLVETFDLLGLPALFLDRHGYVLLVNEAAKRVLAGGIEVRSGHLLAKADDNLALAEFLAAALRDPEARPEATLRMSELTLRALPLPRRSPDPQLMRAIVVVGASGVPDGAMLGDLAAR